ncbi:MAG: hypothetical protein KBA46_06090 [Candidatus Omnitrophica bacterium]|nr:hypothetical protein [Candidatus Omnitrophota bacterium]
MKSFVVYSQAGCLLPFLIIANLFFGLLFFSFGQWILIEIGLVALFFINSFLMVKKIARGTRHTNGSRDGIIDVEAEVVQEKRRLEKD